MTSRIKSNDLPVETATYQFVDAFHAKHTDSEGSYDEDSFSNDFLQLRSDFANFRNKAGVSNMKSSFKKKQEREKFSIALQPFICFEQVAITKRLFPDELSRKYNPYKSAFHHFKYDGLVSFKDGYTADGSIPENKEKFGLTMFDSFTENEKKMWLNAIFRGFQIFMKDFFNMKIVNFNWYYHSLPNYFELSLDLTDKYCISIMESGDEVNKALLNAQLVYSFERPGKINYHDNWTYLRYSVAALCDLIEKN
jgi:hypothetical protein